MKERRVAPRGTKDLLCVLLVAWGILVFFLFFGHSFHLAGSTLSTLGTLGLGLFSAYAFWFLGYRVWRKLRTHVSDELDPFEQSVLEFGLGTSLVMGSMFLAGVFRLYKPWLAYGWLALTLIGPQLTFLADVRGRFIGLLERKGRPGFMPIALLILMGVMTLIASLTPVTSQDALVYHLAVPAHYVDHGGFLYLPGNFFAQFPQNVEMLFTFGMLLNGEELAHWYHWLLAAAATAAVAALSRRLDPRASGLLAAAVFATIPTVGLIAGWAYIDLGVVFFILLSSLCFLRWWGTEKPCWIVLAAVFAGVAAGCKYTAGFQGIVLIGGVFALGAARRWSLLKVAGHSSLAAGTVGLVASPWWIKNVIYTGNPLYPFCYGIFGGANWDQERSEVLSLALKGWGGEHGIIETLLLPWRLTMSGRFFSEANFDGVIGCVFLIAVPVIIGSFWVSREHRLVLGMLLAYTGFWVVTTRQVRFLLPSLAMAAALTGAAVPALLGRGWVHRAMTATLYFAMAFNVLIASLHFAYHNPLLVALGLESKGQFLEREIPGGDYRVFEFIERELPEKSRILLGSLGNPGFLVKRPYYSDSLFENHTLARILADCDSPGATLEAFQKREFTHFLFRWESVFDAEGIKSEIPLEDQKKLMRFLNRYGRRLIQVGGTYLYEIRSR